jgi:hypothetical protein
MAAMAIDDEKLMAYADGELTAAQAAEVERAMAEDEELAGKVAMFADSRSAVKRALGAPPPVPDALAAKIRSMADTDARLRGGNVVEGNVVSLASRRRSVPFWQLPIAASVALAVGFLGGWIGGSDPGQNGGFGIAELSDPALIDALQTVRSGERIDLGGGAEFAAIATFRDGDGALCREFEHDSAGGRTVIGVACREAADWTVEFAVAAASTDAEGYAPASSIDALDAWLSATEAGAPLPEAAEEAALRDLR